MGVRTGLISAVLVLLALSACQRHSEDEIRGLLAGWFDIGATRHFASQRDCTVFQAKVASLRMSGRLGPVDRLEEARRRLLDGQAVAVHLPGRTAAYVSEWFSNRDFGLGLAIVNAARAARPCMTEAFKTGFVEALRRPATVLVFDPERTALTIFDRSSGMIYHMRGAS